RTSFRTHGPRGCVPQRHLGSRVATVPKPNDLDGMSNPRQEQAEIHQTLLVRSSDRPSLYWSMEPTIRLSPGAHQPLRTPCLSLHNATHITPRNKEKRAKVAVFGISRILISCNLR